LGQFQIGCVIEGEPVALASKAVAVHAWLAVFGYLLLSVPSQLDTSLLAMGLHASGAIALQSKPGLRADFSTLKYKGKIQMQLNTSANEQWTEASVCPSNFTSCRLAPSTTIDNGTPRPSTSRLRFDPFFSSIRRVAPHGLLRQRRFAHRPVYTLPLPDDAGQIIVLGQRGAPQRQKDAGRLPLQEVFVDSAWLPNSSFGSAFHWQPVRST
jgi:hypothetical protein